MSDSLPPHGLQHTRPPCPSPTPRVYSNSCPSSRWCPPTILSSVILLFFHLQSFPVSRSFAMSQFFTPGGQNIGGSASASVLPMTTQDWFPLGWTGSPCSPRDSQESSPTPQFKSINPLALSLLHSPTLIYLKIIFKILEFNYYTFLNTESIHVWSIFSEFWFLLPWVILSWQSTPCL